jgi:hypothetical protein
VVQSNSNELHPRLRRPDRDLRAIGRICDSEGLVAVYQWTNDCPELLRSYGPSVSTVATFHDARLVSVDAYADGPDDLELPWDVIGFDCDELGDGRWRFVLHSDVMEWCFESAWPVVERVTTAGGEV